MLTERLTLESVEEAVVVGGVRSAGVVGEDKALDFMVVDDREEEFQGVALAVTVTVVTMVIVEYGQIGTLREGSPTRVCLASQWWLLLEEVVIGSVGGIDADRETLPRV